MASAAPAPTTDPVVVVSEDLQRLSEYRFALRLARIQATMLSDVDGAATQIAESHPSIVVLDRGLARLAVVYLYRQIRANEALAGTRVVFVGHPGEPVPGDQYLPGDASPLAVAGRARALLGLDDATAADGATTGTASSSGTTHTTPAAGQHSAAEEPLTTGGGSAVTEAPPTEAAVPPSATSGTPEAAVSEAAALASPEAARPDVSPPEPAPAPSAEAAAEEGAAGRRETSAAEVSAEPLSDAPSAPVTTRGTSLEDGPETHAAASSTMVSVEPGATAPAVREPPSSEVVSPLTSEEATDEAVAAPAGPGSRLDVVLLRIGLILLILGAAVLLFRPESSSPALTPPTVVPATVAPTASPSPAPR
ncbi:MAG: hypothetical protein IT305_07095 [Chloroflexi bacterium]|nr:hypothetical protein [Chloroflexota bacterium]